MAAVPIESPSCLVCTYYEAILFICLVAARVVASARK